MFYRLEKQKSSMSHSDYLHETNMNFKSYKYRLYPTKDQIVLLNKTFGCVRFVWNNYLGAFNDYNVGPTTANATIKQLKVKIPFLAEVPYNALEQKKRDFEEVKKQFFSKKRKTKLGRPKFKKKGVSKDSFRLSNAGFSFKDNTFLAFRIGKLKLVIDRKFTGVPKSITISRNRCNQYFVSVLVEEQLVLKQNAERSIGIDLGLKDLMILSNGIKISNPKLFRENQSKLKRAQQHLSRKVKGSNRYIRQKYKVAKIHLKITNTRDWLYHSISSWLVGNYNLIVMEDLNVSGMIKNHSLAKSIQDASWSTLVTMIEYKSNWYGRTFHKIDRFYPSSKTCSCCGYKLDSLTLNVREWVCPECNEKHDRDLNAARNILNKGLVDLYSLTSAELTDYRHRELLNPKVINLPKVDSLKCLS